MEKEHGVKVRPGPQDPGLGNVGLQTRDSPPQSIKVGLGIPRKCQSRTAGLQLKVIKVTPHMLLKRSSHEC